MIKLKQLLESTAPDIFIPRRIEDRIERLIKQYIRNGSKGDLILRELPITILGQFSNVVRLFKLQSNQPLTVMSFNIGGNLVNFIGNSLKIKSPLLPLRIYCLINRSILSSILLGTKIDGDLASNNNCLSFIIYQQFV